MNWALSKILAEHGSELSLGVYVAFSYYMPRLLGIMMKCYEDYESSNV